MQTPWWVKGGVEEQAEPTLGYDAVRRAKGAAMGVLLSALAPTAISPRSDLGDRWVSTRCPFHGDRRASASIRMDRFNCHACGIRGDTIDVTMQVLDIGFIEAVAWINENCFTQQKNTTSSFRQRLDNG